MLIGTILFNISALFVFQMKTAIILIADFSLLLIFIGFYYILTNLSWPFLREKPTIKHSKSIKLTLSVTILIVIIFNLFAIFIYPLSAREIIPRDIIMLSIMMYVCWFVKSADNAVGGIFIKNIRVKKKWVAVIYTSIQVGVPLSAFNNTFTRLITGLGGLVLVIGLIMFLFSTIRTK